MRAGFSGKQGLHKNSRRQPPNSRVGCGRCCATDVAAIKEDHLLKALQKIAQMSNVMFISRCGDRAVDDPGFGSRQQCAPSFRNARCWPSCPKPSQDLGREPCSLLTTVLRYNKGAVCCHHFKRAGPGFCYDDLCARVIFAPTLLLNEMPEAQYRRI